MMVKGGSPFDPASFRLADTQWDDLRFPFIGRNIDTASGRIDYDYDELGIGFAANARYNVSEQISMIVQMGHDWKQETSLHPHIHWLQASADIPNWMCEYRVVENGATPGSWTQVKYNTHAFTYTAGTIMQLTEFPLISMAGVTSVSAIIDVKFFRDSANTSTLFAGADPNSSEVIVKEYDIHFERDSLGSDTEYEK